MESGSFGGNCILLLFYHMPGRSDKWEFGGIDFPGKMPYIENEEMMVCSRKQKHCAISF